MSNRQTKWRIMAVILSVAFVLTLIASPLSAFAAPSANSQITLTSEYFPDDAFRAYLANEVFNVQEGSALTQAQLDSVVRISAAGRFFTSLRGIKYFPNLSSVYLDRNSIEILDVSQNPKLEELQCGINPLRTLIVGDLQNLRVIDCSQTHLTQLDLSEAAGLEQLIVDAAGSLSSIQMPADTSTLQILHCSNTRLVQIDTSNCPNLTSYIASFSHLATIDIANSSRMGVLMASGNQLISVHGPGNTVVGASLGNQNPYMIGVAAEGGDYDLANIDPDFAKGQVTNVQGGTIIGSVLSDVHPGDRVTYTYTDGGLSADCTLEITSGNLWIVPLSISGWVEGETPSVPIARPLYGDATFTYALEGSDQFTATVPTQPGTYICRATVPGTATYGSLSSQVTFQIASAADSVPIPTDITAVYMTPLAQIALPDGFTWAENAPQDLGSVGTKQVPALYTRPGTTGPTVSCVIPVRITPMPGSDCTISPITNETEANNITITAPNGYTLQKGKDYTVTSSFGSDTITVVINFMGNFSGTVSRSFESSTGNAWITFPSIANWMQGQTPSTPKADARFGTPEYTYNVNGAWRSEPPTQPGHYILRVTVPETAQYAQLAEDIPFTVYEAVAPAVNDLAAVYREPLAQVPLPEGFEWQNPTELVGNAGEQRHIAFYTPASESLYEGGIVGLSVTVNPKDGQACSISPITNEYESKHIVITDGDYTLEKGVDYNVRSEVEGNRVDVFIDFTGNYYGSAERAFTFGAQNSWVEPVHISNWFVGHEPATPEAAAVYGTPQFSYLVKGNWQSAPPTEAGTYKCRAIVPATQYYDQIESETTFTVYAGNAPVVGTLTAIYGTRLYEVALPTGYAWMQPQQSVGDVGVNRFSATYTASGSSVARTVELSVRVTPKDGSLCTISPIQNQYDGQHITITDGPYKLVKGKDYDITWNLDGNIVQIDIVFKGNYTGTVLRSFSLNQTNDWVVPLSISSWSVGETPVTPIAEPLFGEVTFSYLVNGQWQSEPPTEVGSYEVRAQVPASQYYGSLSATLSFEILPAGESEGAKLQAVADSAVEVRNEKGIGRTLIGRGLTATRTGNTVSEVLLMVESNPHSANYIMEVVDENNTPQDAETIVCTGYKLWLIDMSQNGRVVDQVTIVVLGDVLGEGTVTLSQVVRIAEAFKNPMANPLEGAFLLAGDFYRTGAVALTDLVFEAQLYRGSVSA